MITEDQLPMPMQKLITETGISEYMVRKLIHKRLLRGNVGKAPAKNGRPCLQFIVEWANMDALSYHASKQLDLPL